MKASAASWTCRFGRHWLPPNTCIAPLWMACMVRVLTIRSKRIRGESPNTVASRRMTTPRDSECFSSISSDWMRVRAYRDTGLSHDPSFSTRSELAPYTLHDEAKTKRGTPCRRQASASSRTDS